MSTRMIVSGMFALLLLVDSGCARRIPQAEIDAAENAMADIEGTRDCAPESYLAAKTMMDQAQALLKEKRYDEAKTKFLAAKNLAAKAKAECDEKKNQPKPEDQPAPEPAAKEMNLPAESEVAGNLEMVHFGFDQFSLGDEAKRTLDGNAVYLKKKGVRVQIEGHSDNRGSTEYNLALGEKRALSVKHYLSTQGGIDPKKMEIISYGEERPIETASSEVAYAKNRRAEFQELR